METSIQKLAVVCFFVLGMSHILQPRAWARYLMLLHSKGEPGIFVHAFLTLAMGALIVSFHNIWTGIPTILTVIGWAHVAKSFVYFTFPKIGLRLIGRVSEEKVNLFIAPGIVMVALSGLLFYSILTD